MQLGILFWFYRDVAVCQNRLRLLRRRNPGVPIYGLYGGPPRQVADFTTALASHLDDFWVFPDERDQQWKWRNGDIMLSRWFVERGERLPWDSVFLAQWDLVVISSVTSLLPPMTVGDMLISGVRPVHEVERWWQWTRGDARLEYDAFMAHVASRFGPIEDPMCCQFIGIVAPRAFMARYATIDEPELGFLEYKIPTYAQAFGVRLVPDTCFRPWWPEEPGTSHATRAQSLVHAWRTPVRLPVMLAESMRPGGRRIFHPYHGIYPHDLASLGDAVRRRRDGH
ncbi:MAG TPA: hypothetical protein VMU64_07855 [Acidimicrobiales bacterium]|nr:hypothetical protein [Acidimicrobiales bacterium]